MNIELEIIDYINNYFKKVSATVVVLKIKSLFLLIGSRTLGPFLLVLRNVFCTL